MPLRPRTSRQPAADWPAPPGQEVASGGSLAGAAAGFPSHQISRRRRRTGDEIGAEQSARTHVRVVNDDVISYGLFFLFVLFVFFRRPGAGQSVPRVFLFAIVRM